MAPDAPFEQLMGIEIVKGFVNDRSHRTDDTRQVHPLTCGRDVYVLARGDDHRGGTWFDDTHRVVWLLASGFHRSGSPDDFFPYCKELDRKRVLLPTKEDYEALFRDRDYRFAFTVRIEGPLIAKRARESGKEERVMLGGEFGACVAVELADDLESITVAFQVETTEWDHVPLVLAAFHRGQWEDADRMPSRELEAGEVAFVHYHEATPDG